MKFTYRWGQRPLEGYTIKRGLGVGGFGEVYFALSDGGKEVALKLIRGQSDTELRGIANCLNLKHPNLVHLFDLKTDAQGDRWLVMEYVQGEPLSAILQRKERGLPEAMARDWFLQTARAVAYLHDHAVVHRDIKPANLFVENGIVKLGDYGLSKSVGSSHHSQSSNVGTIHYMAPEVAGGTYSKPIDIYACGVVLYELLTGDVPFKGDSWNEIASKHQTDLPNMRRVPAEYVPILEKALNKKADRRYGEMGEMIRAVEAIGQPIVLEAVPTEKGPTREIRRDAPPRTASRSPGLGSELIASLFLAPFVAVPITACWAGLSGSVNWSKLASLYLNVVAISWAVLVPGKLWEGHKTSAARRLTMVTLGAIVGYVVFWLNGWLHPELLMHDEATPTGFQQSWGGTLRMEEGALDIAVNYMLFFALALGLPRWWQAVERQRREHFTLYPLIAAGACGFFLLGIWFIRVPYYPVEPATFSIIFTLCGAAAVVQIVSPWVRPAPVRSRFRRRLAEAGRAFERSER